MRQLTNRHLFQTLITLLLVIVVSLFIGMMANNQSRVFAQTESKTMRTLLESLNTKLDERPGLIVFFNFQNPLIEGENAWEIGNPEDERLRRMVEIGDDYVCFRDVAGAADGRRCTPYSNIVSITYLNN